MFSSAQARLEVMHNIELGSYIVINVRDTEQVAPWAGIGTRYILVHTFGVLGQSDKLMPCQFLSENKTLLSPFRQAQALNNELCNVRTVGDNDRNVPRARDCRSLVQDIKRTAAKAIDWISCPAHHRGNPFAIGIDL
jgi:hypothetical protein